MEIRKLAPGDRILDYRLLERLGEGGFGEVFRAEHEVLGRIVAIKVPRDQAGLSALRHEGVVQSTLDHPNIVRTLELSISNDPPYVVMDFIDGSSLAQLLKREGKLPWRRAARVLLEAARALAHAHEKGVVHGDVKPGNILVEPGRKGRVLLTDFGLGRVFEGPQGNLQISRSLELASSGAEVQGTIRYMSPEILRGEAADERADIYSFGVLLFEVLTGRLPEGREVPSDLVRDLPPELDRMFARTFTRRERRPTSFDSTIQDLEALVESQPGLFKKSSRVAAKPARKKKVVVAIPADEQAAAVAAEPRRLHKPAPAPASDQTLPEEFVSWRDEVLGVVQERMSERVQDVKVGEGHGFDVSFGVSTEGEPHHRVYALALPRLDAAVARTVVQTARKIFEKEKGIWEKEVTFCVMAQEVADQEQVLWTFKSFSMGWWRRRRIILQDLEQERVFAVELGCDPQGNALKRTFLAASQEAVQNVPRRLAGAAPTLARTCGVRRASRGSAWGAALALIMAFGVLGSIMALELAARCAQIRSHKVGVADASCEEGTLVADGPAIIAVVGEDLRPSATEIEALVHGLLQAREGWTVPGLADRLELPEATVLEALTALETRGLAVLGLAGSEDGALRVGTPQAEASAELPEAKVEPVPPRTPDSFTPEEPKPRELYY